MLTNRVGQLVIIILLAGLLLFALGSERGSIPASAEPQAMPMQAVPGGPGYVMVPAVAFQPESSTDSFLIFWGELSVPVGSPKALTQFYAPLYLPQGARLTGMTVFYRDNISDANTLGVDLYRKPLPSTNSGETTGLGVYSNQIGMTLYQSDTTPYAPNAVVDNSQYSYWLAAYIYRAPTYLQLQAVRVDYSYDLVLPLVRH